VIKVILQSLEKVLLSKARSACKLNDCSGLRIKAPDWGGPVNSEKLIRWDVYYNGTLRWHVSRHNPSTKCLNVDSN